MRKSAKVRHPQSHFNNATKIKSAVRFFDSLRYKRGMLTIIFPKKGSPLDEKTYLIDMAKCSESCTA